MLIINKNVRFSIKLPRLWHICSILVLQPMVYWIFFVSFCHHHCWVCQLYCYHCLPRKGRLVALKKFFALCFREVTAGPHPEQAGRKELGKRCPSQMSPQDLACHLFNQSSPLPLKDSSILAVQDHLSPSQQELHTAFVLSILLLCAR